jgi:hypothetical protein
LIPNTRRDKEYRITDVSMKLIIAGWHVRRVKEQQTDVWYHGVHKGDHSHQHEQDTGEGRHCRRQVLRRQEAVTAEIEVIIILH